MADKKISALTGATTPLAGTEVLPIVQGGSTVNVSVANLTAGRAISATELTLTTGNLIVSNGKGIDFSLTPGTGTSELFDDYEEGTWTPTIVAGALTINNTSCFYTKIGEQVTVFFDVTFPVQVNANDADLFALPFTIKSTGGSAAAISTDRSATDPTFAYGFNGQVRLRFNDGLLAVLTLTQMSGKRVKGSFTYQV
jgi:hypothetical protein